MSACYLCKSTIDVPPQQEEEQRVQCPECGVTTIVAGRCECREAGVRLRRETFRQLGIRPPSSKFEEAGWHPGETPNAHRRRVNLLQGRDAEDDGGGG